MTGVVKEDQIVPLIFLVQGKVMVSLLAVWPSEPSLWGLHALAKRQPAQPALSPPVFPPRNYVNLFFKDEVSMAGRDQTQCFNLTGGTDGNHCQQ